MSSKKTPNLNLHSWIESDKVLRSEFVDNFNKIDAKFNASTGHSHDGTPGSGGKLAATSVDYTSEKNAKEILDELFQSANRYNKSIADTIGVEYDEKGNVYYNNMQSLVSKTFDLKEAIRKSIGNKHGYSHPDDTIADLKQRILEIPYNLEPQGTADATDVAMGKTFLNRTAALITGTRDIKTSAIYSPKAVNFNIPNAIYKNSIISGEVDLLPENIKKDVSIYGVTGNYVPVQGYNPGDKIEYFKVPNSYVSSTQGVILGDSTAICPRGFVWTALKQISQYLIKNINFPDQQFYFSPSSNVKSMTIDFNGFYFLTEDMVYCFDYLTFKHKWGVPISNFIPSGDAIVGVFTNHLGEVIIVSKQGRIFVVNNENGNVTDMYKIKEEFQYPVTIAKTSQRFSCDDIILIDTTNELCFYIDSDINNDNNTRVLYQSKSNYNEILDILTTDYKTSYILKKHYNNTKMVFIESYDYGKATTDTVAIEIGQCKVNSMPEKIYQIKEMTFLLIAPKEVIVYDAITDLVLFRKDVDININTLCVSNDEDIFYRNNTTSGSLRLSPGPRMISYKNTAKTYGNNIPVKDVSINIDKIL